MRPSLWTAFRDVSLWVEALAIHEWSLFTARVSGVTRGDAYQRLTERPDGLRLPLTWERNLISVRMLEGDTFVCPWSGRHLTPDTYQLDHIVPLAIHPFHELWNLIPAHPRVNMHEKRDRLPSHTAMLRAAPILRASYASYDASPALRNALQEDVAVRFRRHEGGSWSPSAITDAVVDLTVSIATLRNVRTYEPARP